MRKTKMMDCDAYRILISGYLDGELSEDEMQKLKAHLETCAGCLAHLKQMETMETALKRYKLLQEVPEVPPDFARNISVILQGVVAKESLSFGAKVKQTYQEFVLGIAERWARSLRTRPFAWTTAVSVLLVCIVGIVFADLFRTMYAGRSEPYSEFSPKSVVQLAQKDTTFVEEESPPSPTGAPEIVSLGETSAQAPVEDESLPPIEYVDITPDSGIPAAKQDGIAVIREEEQQPAGIEVSRDQSMDKMKVIEGAEGVITRVVKSDNVSVDDYVYSHVLEVAQDQFIDDALFVGYVQDAFFE